MKKFIKNLKISHTLILMSVIITIFIVGQNYSTILNLKKSRNYVQMLKDERIEPILALYAIKHEYAINIVDAANKVHHNSISWEEANRTILNARKEINKKWKQYSEAAKDYESKKQLLAIRTLMQKSNLVLDKLEHYIATRDQSGLEDLITNGLYPAIEPITDALQTIVLKQRKAISKIASESNDLYEVSISRSRNIGISGILIIISFAVFLIVMITKPLKKANALIKKITDGDLTVQIEGYGNDEIGKLVHNIKRLVENLRNIVENINSAASNIAITSQELSTNSQQISQGATEQAASAEEIATSMEEISTKVVQNAKNANMTEQISIRAGNEFENGRENINKTVDAIQTIASKISIIDEIAFQTNILALNAAVEAARAGKHGKGFGVVATEVGKLAERSKIAASEIADLSKSGVKLTHKSKELLQIASPSAKNTIQLIKEISRASADQSTSIDQINTGIQTLNQVTQQNAASSEEMATVAEEMAAQAEQLSNSIRFFNIGKDKKEETKNTNPPKFIEYKKPLKNNKKEEQKGIELDLNSQDDLDSEFETF